MLAVVSTGLGAVVVTGGWDTTMHGCNLGIEFGGGATETEATPGKSVGGGLIILARTGEAMRVAALAAAAAAAAAAAPAATAAVDAGDGDIVLWNLAAETGMIGADAGAALGTMQGGPATEAE
mmetsp:Transcript_68356/g.164020  ORF Transcript_68356/g.164020 Transcript_68356/m.164020 type:complete len:123 (+) Transcript_68356:2354-2722(+)